MLNALLLSTGAIVGIVVGAVFLILLIAIVAWWIGTRNDFVRLKNKVEEIIASTDYKKKIEDLANEIVDFSINGYKEAMKNRIVERMVGNVLDAQPYFSGQSLVQIINEVIDSRLH